MAHAQACPECGAHEVDGLDCWGQLGGIIAWESGNPELFAVHFLTVASYNLQHPSRYTEEAITGLRTLFIEAVDQDLSGEAIRRRIGKSLDGPQRVMRRESERNPTLIRWPMTIADVYLPDQPEGASDRVRKWAAAIRREL